MARVSSYKTPPIRHKDPVEWLRQTVQAVRRIMEGKINATGTVTLTASSATSTLTDALIGNDTVIVFMPKTANAAAEMDSLYVSARTTGSSTLTHANNGQTDRTFDYIAIG
jgi:sugar (pentulose or hexulose) kinase|tara:strand:- start:2250 stop:2582 length:333 start_codon:yes stop_codon:yes gene_type:complete